MERSGTVLLIHGGLWENIGAEWFWGRTGVIGGLEERGFTVLAPDRLRQATSWTAEAKHLADVVAREELLGDSVTVVGGSFGCAATVRLALDFPGLAGRLLLAWPASVSDQFTAIRARADLTRQGARAAVVDALLGTETLPSATDAELRTLNMPVGVVRSLPPDPFHPRTTVDALLRILPSASELPASPEAPLPEFASYRESFLDTVAAFAFP